MHRRPSARAKATAQLLDRIRQIQAGSQGRYGSPRIHAQLRREGLRCGHNRVARLMRDHRIVAHRWRTFKRQAAPVSGRQLSENLVQQQFAVARPNTVWVADISCLWTGSGWLYLAVVLDLYSRRIVGWAMQGRMTEQLVIDALQMAWLRRQPTHTLIHHSDQGSQYAGERFQAQLSAQGIRGSMSRRGNCYDNAVVESFFKTLKTELIHGQRFTTREDARTAIFDYVEVFYNRQRLHSTLGYRSPVEFEEQSVPASGVHQTG
jgi:transposase InsO family protein